MKKNKILIISAAMILAGIALLILASCGGNNIPTSRGSITVLNSKDEKIVSVFFDLYLDNYLSEITIVDDAKFNFLKGVQRDAFREYIKQNGWHLSSDVMMEK